MWRLSRTDTFARTARKLLKRSPHLLDPLAGALEQLEKDPWHPQLKLHRLRGQLDGLWAVRVTYQIRIVLLVDEGQRELTLLDIGSHDDVYR
jgi:addiction module RelE/StbE family toxin